MTSRAAIYCRISQDRVGAGLGVERQEQDCRTLAEHLGVDVVAVYCDNDLSAYSGKPRPKYRHLLKAIETGDVDVVVAWHTDRLHRSPAELEEYIAVCDPRGVPTHTVKAGALDLSTATGRMTARITGAVARHESEQKSERLKRQRRQTQAEGGWHGGRRPFGFEPDGILHRQAEAEAIAAAVRDILAGHSLRSIVRRWNDAGLTTSTGERWDASNLRQMLLRPRNAGLVGKERRIVGPAKWAPIVERETWEALVAKLRDPARTTHRGTSRKLVGSFLYRCECGELVRSGGTLPPRKDAQRYTCPDGHLRRLAGPIDDLVLDAVERVLVRDGVALIQHSPDLAPLRERLTVLRARAEEIAAMFADPDSGMTAVQFRVSNERIQGDIRAVEATIGRHTADSALSGVADAADPGKAFRDLDIDRQRQVIDALVTVTLRRQRAGRQPDGSYFNPESVRIAPRERSSESS